MTITSEAAARSSAQRAAAALDQGQLRIDLIGAVDGEIELRVSSSVNGTPLVAKYGGAPEARNAGQSAGGDLSPAAARTSAVVVPMLPHAVAT
jgi:hypothetical protein